MAIKIDLLPGYVGLTKTFHRVIAGAVVGLALWTGGLILVYNSKKLELATATKNQEVVEGIAKLTVAAQTARDDAIGKAAGYDAANSFMLAACKTGAERAALLNLITKYITRNSVVKSIDVSDGRNVTIVATVTTPDEYMQFLLNLRKANGVLFAGDPRFTTSGVGGYGNGAAPLVVPQRDPGSPPVLFNYPITLTAQGVLLYPLTSPNDPSGGAAPATGTGSVSSSSSSIPSSPSATPAR